MATVNKKQINEIINNCKTLVDETLGDDDELLVKELVKIITKECKKITNPKKEKKTKKEKEEGGEVKAKRAPTAYNIFLQKKIEELKEDPEYADTPKKELFKLAATFWAGEKEKKITEFLKDDDEEEIKEVVVVEDKKKKPKKSDDEEVVDDKKKKPKKEPKEPKKTKKVKNSDDEEDD